MSKRGNILAVVGGQYGSEGKGVVVGHLAEKYEVHVRVGAPNAGHSFVHPTGGLFKMQGIPVGWKNPNARLIIGRGGLVSPEILLRELEAIRAVDSTIDDRLRIDAKAGVLDARFHAAEGGTAGDMHRRIGSTGEGVGLARVARIMRDPAQFSHFGDVADALGLAHLVVRDTPELLEEWNGGGDNILLEGSQGSALSLLHGPWPYVTSTDCNSAQLAADVGIPPRYVNRCLLVVRTFPIRVAGNSGPLEGETTWEELSRRLGRETVERTTVTNKVRRVGDWDDALVARAVTLNAPTSFAVMFLDYLSPEDVGKVHMSQLSARSVSFLGYVERMYRTPVALAGTGGDPWTVVETGKPL